MLYGDKPIGYCENRKEHINTLYMYVQHEEFLTL